MKFEKGQKVKVLPQCQITKEWAQDDDFSPLGFWSLSMPSLVGAEGEVVFPSGGVVFQDQTRSIGVQFPYGRTWYFHQDELELVEEVASDALTLEKIQEQSLAYSLIQEAAECLKSRASERDKPKGERSMKTTVDMFNIASGLSLTEEQGWLFMVILKIARSQGGGYKRDDYVDGSAYFGLMGEAADRERGVK